MKKNIFSAIMVLIVLPSSLIFAQGVVADYPSAEIANKKVKMKLYLPDPVKGSYRATRFDWSGIILSLQWEGHEFFGEWKSTHDPLVHEDLSGPVEGSVGSGMGYNEAKAGGHFVRLGVGVLERPDDKEFHWAQTYKIIDNGTWTVNKGGDWIEFRQEVKSDIGYAYIYTKKISLKKKEPGFIITHKLINTGTKDIDIDFFNHNFFRIDGEPSGRNFLVKFPYQCTTETDTKGIVLLEKNELNFQKDLSGDSTIWIEVKGYGTDPMDHQATVINKKSGVGINFTLDKPLTKMAFWACRTTLCPENFIQVKIAPGTEDNWTSNYTLFNTGDSSKK